MPSSSFECVTIQSETWKGFADGAPCVLGIDEAGRGPVLGPMVYGAAISPVSAAEELKALGVADSKALTEEKRGQIFDKMNNDMDTKKVVAYALRSLQPQLISAAMLQRAKCSLNQLSHDAAIALIKDALDYGVNVVDIFVDTVGPKATYQAKLDNMFPGISITVTEKADALFPVVSAASIAAKVSRDRQLASWEFAENGPLLKEIKLGSGYPSDPATKAYLAKTVDGVFGYPGLIRFSWKTVDTILDKKAVELKWEADEEDGGKKQSLSKMWSSKDTPTVKRNTFFTERKLVNACNF